ncbi:hypothetical protein EsH8_II_000311 [Colletotrichum jinshuiense]
MEPAGLAAGVLGLVGLFSSCLEIMEKVDSYRDFNQDSRSLSAQFDAEKIRFKRWGCAIGLGQGELCDNHHAALKDVQTLSMTKELLSLIQEILGDADAVSKPLVLVEPKSAKNTSYFTSHAQPYQGALSESKRHKIVWSLRGKGRRMAQVERFGDLVQCLHNLVPPDDAQGNALDGPIRMGAGIPELREILGRMEEERKAETRRKLHAWLGCNSPNDIYLKSIQERLESTCDWILDRPAFLDWRSQDIITADTVKSMWINGPAGLGKTVLCARVVEHLRATLRTPVAHFFLSSEFESRDDPFAAVRSWVDQIVFGNQVAFELVRDRWLDQQEQVATRANVVNLFREIVQAVPGCIFVLDGLDECTWIGKSRYGNKSVHEFLGAVMRAVADTTTRILVVSRDEPEIRSGMCGSEGCFELTITPEDVRSDVTLYSKSIVDRKLPKMDEATRGGVSQRMADRCNGQFLWIKLHEDSLRSWKNKQQLEDAINETPPGLDYFYERNWERISRLPNQERSRAYSLLRWAAFALRPLTICEITEAVLINERCDDLPVEELPDSISDDYIDSEIRGPCGSLLEIRSTSSEQDAGLWTVHLTHFSVKQYFLCNIQAQSAHLFANESLRSSSEALQSTELAKLCLRYVNYRRVWEDATKKEAGGVEKSFRDYAAGSWYQHALTSEEGDRALAVLMNTLFDLSNPCWNAWSRWFDTHNGGSKQEMGRTNEAFGNPLQYASQLGFVGLVKHLIYECQHPVNEKANLGRTALDIAADHGNTALLEVLLNAGADTAIANDIGWTPVHSASVMGHLETARLLLNNEADITIADEKGFTPLALASAMGHVDVVKLLLDNGADMRAANNVGLKPLSLASAMGHVETARLLLDNGADVVTVDKNEPDPLLLASTMGHVETIRLLLDNGADITAANNGFTPLLLASADGKVEVVKLLLDKGADITVANNEGFTSLLLAVAKGQVEVVKLLLDNGADITVSNNEGLTPLLLAAAEGRVEVVKLLLDNGADIAVVSNRGYTPLSLSSGNGKAEVVKLLLDNGADMRVANNVGLAPILLASMAGQVEVVKLLLDSGADITVTDEDGSTPLLLASAAREIEVVKLLLENGASTAAVNKIGLSPLLVASADGQVEVARLLLDNGADMTVVDNNGRTPLSLASYRGQVDVARLLLDNRADMAVVNKDGFTPLSLASAMGHIEVARLLVGNGADMTVVNKDEFTPLAIASAMGHVAVARLLLDNGADMTVVNKDGLTPLSLASAMGHTEAARMLLDNGADITAVDKNGWTLLHSASDNGHTEVVRLLLDKGANVTVASNEGWTPLNCASKNGHTEVVKLLLERGADITVENDDGWTPIDSASNNGHTEVVGLLLNKGPGITAVDNHG